MVLGVFSGFVLLILPMPPAARELGAICIPSTTPTGQLDSLCFALTFRFSVDTFSPWPPCEGQSVAFGDVIFLPLKARPSFLTLFRVPFRVCNLAVERCRGGSKSWRVFDSYPSSWKRGFHDFPLILHVRLIRVG